MVGKSWYQIIGISDDYLYKQLASSLALDIPCYNFREYILVCRQYDRPNSDLFREDWENRVQLTQYFIICIGFH